MVLRIVQVLCLVAIFCACNALTTYGRDRPGFFHMGIRHRPFLSRRYYDYDSDYDMHPVSMVQTTTEAQEKEYEKEYGIKYVEESKQYNKNNKKQLYVSENQLTWTEARDTCERMGMVLASPTSQNEEVDLENYIRENSLVPQDKFSGFWIGIRRLSANDPWILESSSQESLNLGWLPGEPNGYEGEDCVELKKDWGLGWNNYYCDGLRRYICENIPNSFGSDKNIVEDREETLHEEIVKELNIMQVMPESVTEPKDDQVDPIENIQTQPETIEDPNLSLDHFKQTDVLGSSTEKIDRSDEISRVRAYIQHLAERNDIELTSEDIDWAVKNLRLSASGDLLMPDEFESEQISIGDDDIVDNTNFDSISPSTESSLESDYLADVYSNEEYSGIGH